MPSSRSELTSELPWFSSAVAMAVVCGLAAFASSVAPVEAVSAVSDQPAWQFLVAFAVGTLLVLLLLKTVHGSRLFSTIFLAAVATGAGYLGIVVAGPGTAVLLAAAVVLIRFAWPVVAVHDAILILGLAGIAADLGDAMKPVTVLVILAILSFYDIIAVYGTKHMVRMAGSLLRHKAFFAMILPAKTAGFLARIDKVEPGRGFTFLGTGDLALPAMLAASAARLDPVLAAATAAGAVLGIAVLGLLFTGRNKGSPMPALPPVAACAIAAYALASLFR